MKVLLLSQIAKVDYKFTYSLANSLKDCGNEVELVIDDKKDNEYCKCKCFNKFLTSRKDINKIEKLKNYIETYKYIEKKLIQEKFDVLHIQWLQFSPIDYKYLKKIRRKGIKIVITVHDILPFNEKIYDKFFHKKIYELCDYIILQAQTNIDRFKEIFPRCSNKIKYIPHGHFLDFADIYEKDKAREHLKIPKNKKVFLFFGQIKKVKGVGILLEAFGELCKKREDVFLIVAGSVWKDDFSSYQRIIEKENLNEENLKTDIRFIPDNEVGYYYSASDIAVLPYLDVYQSGVIQLAYAYNKPAIATAIKPFMEIVEDEKTGFLCNPNDSRDLMKVMEKALNNEKKFEQFGKNGNNKIKEIYSWKKIAEQVTKLYMDC